MPAAPIAYSYLRFSHPAQAAGDSCRRQAELRDAWCSRNGVRLDDAVHMRDEGVSGYSGDHRGDSRALGAFLGLVRAGRVPAGSYLVIENLDRLSREDIVPALSLLLELIRAGVRVVQLLPVEQVFDSRVEPMALMMAIMELSRGHSESRMKSERLSRAWANKKEKAKADGTPLTKTGPAWLELRDGRWHVVEERAAAVRLIFDLAGGGLGSSTIVRRLNETKVPPISGGPYWSASYVAKIMSHRAVLGEFQPMKWVGGKPRPEGPPVPDYYPAIVDPDRWAAARAVSARRRPAGRGTAVVNLFAGLLWDARSDGPVHVTVKSGVRYYTPYLERIGVAPADGRQAAFPVAAFEPAVLSSLREIDPAAVFPREGAGPDPVRVLEGRVADLDARLSALAVELERGVSRTLADHARRLEAERDAAAAGLEEARNATASPAAHGLAAVGSLADAVAAADDPTEARARLRAAIRQAVEEVRCVFAARGVVRLACVQVAFRGGAVRRFLIAYRPTHLAGDRRAASGFRVLSYAVGADDTAGPDLRRAEDAKAVADSLAVIGMEAFGW